MLLASDPDQTYTIGQTEDTLAPKEGEPAFVFRYMTARQLREYREWGSDINGRLKRPDNEVSEELFDRIRKYLVRCDVILAVDSSTPDLEDHLTESEAWNLFWHMCSANKLGPEALKNFESPSPTNSDASAAAIAESAKTPPTPSSASTSSAPPAPESETTAKPATDAEPTS